MSEYFHEAVEIFEPDTELDAEALLEQTCHADPVEAIRQELIAQGITDPEEQKTILQHAFRVIEDGGVYR